MAPTLNSEPRKRGRKPRTEETSVKTLRDQLKEDLLKQGYFTECKFEEENKVRSWLEIRRPGVSSIAAYDGAQAKIITISMVFNFEGTRLLSIEANQETYVVTNQEQSKVFC